MNASKTIKGVDVFTGSDGLVGVFTETAGACGRCHALHHAWKVYRGEVLCNGCIDAAIKEGGRDAQPLH